VGGGGGTERKAGSMGSLDCVEDTVHKQLRVGRLIDHTPNPTDAHARIATHALAGAHSMRPHSPAEPTPTRLIYFLGSRDHGREPEMKEFDGSDAGSNRTVASPRAGAS